MLWTPLMFVNWTEILWPWTRHSSKDPQSWLEEKYLLPLFWVLDVLRVSSEAASWFSLRELDPELRASGWIWLNHTGQTPEIFAFKHLTFALCYPFIRKIKTEREASEARAFFFSFCKNSLFPWHLYSELFLNDKQIVRRCYFLSFCFGSSLGGCNVRETASLGWWLSGIGIEEEIGLGVCGYVLWGLL
jgi:hypothetical protein